MVPYVHRLVPNRINKKVNILSTVVSVGAHTKLGRICIAWIILITVCV